MTNSIKSNKYLLWSERIKECKNSNLSSKRWCKENSINSSTYNYWVKKLDYKDNTSETEWAEVNVIPTVFSNSSKQPIIVYFHESKIEIPVEFNSRSSFWSEFFMLAGVADAVEHIYIACDYTDFRKQIEILSALVSFKFRLDPYTSNCVFLFCNKRHSSIKALRWDGDGFILVTKKLMEEMRFQWPKNPEEAKDIYSQELRWLLEGVSINRPKAHKKIDIPEDACFNFRVNLFQKN